MLARRSVLVFATSITSGLLGFAGLFLFARFAPDPEETLGVVGFALGLVGSFFVLTGLGVPPAHVKRVSQGEPLDQCVGAFALLQTVQIGLATGATLLGIYLWTEVLGRGFETPLHVRAILVVVIYFIVIKIANVGTFTFDSRLETAKSQTSVFAGTVARVAGMAVVALVGLGAVALSWVYVFSAFATAGVALLLLRSYPLARPPRALLRSYLRFAFPLSIPAALVALSHNIDKAILQLFWGAAEVGYYFVAQRLALFLTIITSGVSLLLFPSISRYHARNEIDVLRRKAAEAERYLSMALAPLAAFLILYSEGLIHVLLSDPFLPAAGVLRLFAVITFTLGLMVPRRAILKGMDRPGLTGIANLAGALVTIALYPILIPTSFLGVPLLGMGPVGAAASVLVGYVVAFVLALAFSRRLVGDRLHRTIAYHVGAAAAVGILFFLLIPPAAGLDWRWFHLLGVSLAFLGTYLGLLVLLGEFKRRDLKLFVEALNPRKMAMYVQEELTESSRGK